MLFLHLTLGLFPQLLMLISQLPETIIVVGLVLTSLVEHYSGYLLILFVKRLFRLGSKLRFLTVVRLMVLDIVSWLINLILSLMKTCYTWDYSWERHIYKTLDWILCFLFNLLNITSFIIFWTIVMANFYFSIWELLKFFK